MSPEHKKNEIRNLAIMAFVNNPKSLTRGGIAGSTLGSLAGIAYALVSNQPISEGVMIVGALSGGAVGAGLDSFVHLIRYTAKFL